MGTTSTAYTAVLRPIVLNGICVWWTAFNKNSYLNSLMKVQRQAELCIRKLSRKLSWKQNCQERARKATIALDTCKNAIGKRWGLQPKVVHWPIVLYGICVWWTALNKKSYLNSLMKVQRQAELCISGALKTTPSAALDILLNFPTLDIMGKKLLKTQLSDWELMTCGSLITTVTQI